MKELIKQIHEPTNQIKRIKKYKNGDKNMSKEYIKTTEERENETLLEQFQKYMEEDDSDARVVQFLSMQNAKVLKRVGAGGRVSVNEDEFNEYCDFYEYFMVNYYEKTFKALSKAWGGKYPLIFDVIENLIESRHLSMMKMITTRFKAENPKLYEEAVFLSDQIMAIRKDRLLLRVNTEGVFVSEIKIPRTVPKELLRCLKADVLYFCLSMVFDGGAACLYVEDKDSRKMMMFHPEEENGWVSVKREEVDAALEDYNNSDVKLESAELEDFFIC